MSEPTDRPIKNDGLPSARPPSAGRRRLLRGGLGASPLLLTLASRPALGGGTGRQCFSPSGFVSMPTSVHGEPTLCNGRSPGYWKNWPKKSWPAPYHPNVKFKSVFTTLGIGQAFKTMTLMQVLETGGGGGVADMGRYIVAALLNAQSGKTPVLSVQAVKDLWSDYEADGQAEVTAGVFWGPEEIKAYIESTWFDGN